MERQVLLTSASLSLWIDEGFFFDACEMLQCGWTALAFAARYGKVEAVELLLRWGKNSGFLPREVRHTQIFKVLDYSDCILPLVENVFKAAYPRFFRWSPSFSSLGGRQIVQDGVTALMIAAEEGHAKTAEVLLANGRDVDAKTKVRCLQLIFEGCEVALFLSAVVDVHDEIDRFVN